MGLVAMPPDMPLRCAMYARVSPKPEGAAGDNFSIKSQIHEMRELARKDFGCDAPDEYIDKDKSGATLDRPALDRLRDNIAAKLYDVVIAYSPDRWTRGEELDNLILDQELKKGGARLAFVSGSYEDTAEGSLSRDVQNAVSRFERRKFKERARRCRRQKSRDGHPHACLPPDGYKYEGHQFGKRGEFVIVPERAKVVKLIFEKTAEGMTNSRLALWLNEEGIETFNAWLHRQRRGKTRRKLSASWHRNSVTQVLEKTAYYGEIAQNGEKIKVPAIVSRELWDRAHEALARNLIGRVGRPPREYLLSGRIWCARCGERCTTFPNHGNPAYRCNNIDHTNRSVRFCFAPQIAKAIIEPLVWEKVWDAVENPGLLWQLIEAYHERVSGKPAKKNPAIARIDKARAQVALAERILKDPRKPIPYEEAVDDLEAARKELAAAQIAGGAAVAIMPLRKNVEAAAAEFRAMRRELQTFERRRKALLLLVEQIRYADDKVEIRCHLPGPTSKNCNHRACDDGNFSGAFPFVINCSIPNRKRAA